MWKSDKLLDRFISTMLLNILDFVSIRVESASDSLLDSDLESVLIAL